MTTLVLTVAGALLLAAGLIMIAQGVLGRRSLVRELDQQRIAFPSTGLPDALARYADVPVRTGPAARAYADLIAGHLAQATGGRTYAEIAQECMGAGRGDERLDRLRQTAFMGQSLRGALLGAYQAWQVTALVIGLGGLVLLIGATFLLLGLRL